jgi:hypothetical protein
MRRFSLTGWGSDAAPPVTSSEPDRSSGKFASDADGKGRAQVEGVVQEIQPIQPQTTGGLWGSWWASSGGESAVPGEIAGTKEISKSANWYTDALQGRKLADSKLSKQLISLRVHLSTAKLAWIEEFIDKERGMDALGALLAGLVGKGGKRRNLNDMETTVLLELVKCLRVLLNTEVSLQFLLR